MSNEYFVTYYHNHKHQMDQATKRYHLRTRISALSVKISECADEKKLEKLNKRLQTAQDKYTQLVQEYLDRKANNHA